MTVSTTLTLSPFAGFLQMAYVTTDLTQAIAMFAQRYNIPHWAELRELEIATKDGRTCRANVSLAFLGPVQYELIQPLGGDDAIYREPLPPSGFAVKHHHVAQLMNSETDFERQRAEMLAQGHTLTLDGESPGAMRYFYTDHRALLGHYIEHTWYSPAGLAFMAQLPRN